MKYLRILLIQCNDVFQQRARSFVWFLLALIMPLVTLIFWQGAFQKHSVIGGWTISDIRSYYLLNVIAGSLLMAHIELWVAYNEIKEGNIASALLKPLSYLWLMFAYETPWRLIQGAFGLITLIIFLMLGLQINISSHPEIILLSCVISASALILSYLMKMCIALLAFWFTDINALLETQEVFIIIFAGFIMPIDLLPWNIHTVSLFTPFPYIIYFPILSFIGKLSSPDLLHVLLAQWVWIGLLFVIYNIMWKRGVYKFSGVGM